MSRIADYFVVVSFGSSLDPIDPAELHGSLMDADQAAGTGMKKTMEGGGVEENGLPSTRNEAALALTAADSVAAAVAQVGGAGGAKEVEVSTTRLSSNNLSPNSYAGTTLSPIAGSPMNPANSPATHHSIASSASPSLTSPAAVDQSASSQNSLPSPAQSPGLNPSTTSPQMPLSPASSLGLSGSGSPPSVGDSSGSDSTPPSGSPSVPTATGGALQGTLEVSPSDEPALTPALLAPIPSHPQVFPASPAAAAAAAVPLPPDTLVSPTAAAAAAVPLPEDSPRTLNGVSLEPMREDPTSNASALSIVLSPQNAMHASKEALVSPNGNLLSPNPAVTSPTQPLSTAHAHSSSNPSNLAVSLLSPAAGTSTFSPNSTTLHPTDLSPPQQLAISTKTPTMAGSPQEQASLLHSMKNSLVSSTPRSLLSFTERIYRGKIVDRFPQTDHRSVPFPPGISMFCIPDDITLSTVPDLPVFYFFAATGANGVRLYGSCLKFAEPLPKEVAQRVWEEEKQVQENKMRWESMTGGPVPVRTPGGTSARGNGAGAVVTTMRQSPSLSRRFGAPFSSSTSTTMSARGGGHNASHALGSARGGSSTATSNAALSSTSSNGEIYSWCLLPPEKRPAIYASKCLCLLSTYPFLKPFREFLTGLYRLSLTPSPLPIERILCNFMCGEVPLPPLGEIKVQYALGDSIITFARPPANNPFGFHHFPIRLLFECLDFAHVLLVFECLLCEKRILLLSSKLSSLTIVAETLIALLYPFTWPHVYIPLLPKALIDFLHAPMPFVIGMHASYIDVQALQGDILEDLVIVDLDLNEVTLCGPTRKPPSLPQKEKKKLWKKLKPLHLYSKEKNEYEQKLMDTMDLAFSNAPLPDETDTAEHARLNIQQLVSVEINKNQNHSPKSAVKTIDGHQHLFSSGLHTTSHRGSGVNGSHGGGGSKGSATRLTSPSALGSGRSSSTSASGGGAFFSSPKPSQSHHRSSSSAASSAATSSLYDSEFASIDYLICSAFFRVFISLFKDYRPYLIFPTAGNPFPDPCFDVKGFIKGMEGGHGRSGSGVNGVEEWMLEFTKTQSFRKFVEDRTFPVTSKEQQKRLTFWEESILAKRNRSKFTRKYETPFLKDRSTDLQKTFVAPSPDTSNLPIGASWVYPVFPILNPSLFVKPRINRSSMGSSSSSGGGLLLGSSKGAAAMLIGQSGISLGSWQPKKTGAATSLSGAAAAVFSGGKKSAKAAGGSAIQTTSGEQVIATLWFVLFAAIIGENRQTAALDTAFQVLINIRNNGLQPDEEIFPCLMFACGSCGVPERAIDVLREMTNSGYQPDAATYAALLQVFSMNGDHRGAEALANLKGGAGGSTPTANSNTTPITAGALVSSIKRELSKPTLKSSSSLSGSSNTSGSSSPAHPAAESTTQTFYQHPYDPRDPNSPCSSPQPLKIQQIAESERINMFRLQFELIFAGLEVRTEEECEDCGKKVEDHDIRAGWTQLSNDYTTACPHCGSRFVARFSVVSKAWLAEKEAERKRREREDVTVVKQPGGALSVQPPMSPGQSMIADQLSPDSLALFKATRTLAAAALQEAAEQAQADESAKSQDEKPPAPAVPVSHHPPTPPILVEYLSPRVLKKEVIHLLEVRPARYFTSRSFRTGSPALFWNLVWHFTNQCFPVDFLLRKERREDSLGGGGAASDTPSSRNSDASPSKLQQQQQRRRKKAHARSLSGVAEDVPASAATLLAPDGLLLDSPSRAPPDDFEREIAAARVSGVGRAFGYGSGGMLAGHGAVGVSLGAMMRTRAALPELQKAVEADLQQTSEEDWNTTDEEAEEELELTPATAATAPVAAAASTPGSMDSSHSTNGHTSARNGKPNAPTSPSKVVFHVAEAEHKATTEGAVEAL